MGTHTSIFKYEKATIHHIGPHIKLVHASNRSKCKKVTAHHIGHASNRLKCKKVTTHHIGPHIKLVLHIILAIYCY